MSADEQTESAGKAVVKAGAAGNVEITFTLK